MEIKQSSVQYLPLIEFFYNNIYEESIQGVPYEVLYEHKCRSPLYWNEFSECRVLGQEII